MPRIKVKTITIPGPPVLMDALDELVEAGKAPEVYPPPTRTSVVRALIQEAHAKLRRAKAKAPPPLTVDDYKPGDRVVVTMGAIEYQAIVHEDSGFCDEVSPYAVLVTIEGGKRDGQTWGLNATNVRRAKRSEAVHDIARAVLEAMAGKVSGVSVDALASAAALHRDPELLPSAVFDVSLAAMMFAASMARARGFGEDADRADAMMTSIVRLSSGDAWGALETVAAWQLLTAEQAAALGHAIVADAEATKAFDEAAW